MTKKKLIIICLIVVVIFYWFCFRTNPKDYGINDLEKVQISFESGGGYSNFRSVQIEVNNQEALCTIEYFGINREKLKVVDKVKLPAGYMKQMVYLFAMLDFYNLDVKKISFWRVTDAALSRIKFEYKGKKNEVVYGGLIKHISIGGKFFPAGLSEYWLQSLARTFWKIFNQAEYKYILGNYHLLDGETLMNRLSSLDDMISDNEFVDNNEFIPMLIQIIEDEERCKDPAAGEAIQALEAIIGKAFQDKSVLRPDWIKWCQEHKEEYNKYKIEPARLETGKKIEHFDASGRVIKELYK